LVNTKYTFEFSPPEKNDGTVKTILPADGSISNINSGKYGIAIACTNSDTSISSRHNELDNGNPNIWENKIYMNSRHGYESN